MVVCGLLIVACSRLAASDASSEQIMEVRNVTYDYQIREQTEYYSADIIGEMDVTLYCKGYSYFRAMFTGGHFSSEDEAPIFREWTAFCNPEGEEVLVRFPIITWGSWIKCGYFSHELQEMVYIPSICSNDYIDPADLAAVTGGVEDVVADDEISVAMVNDAIRISGVNDANLAVSVYNVQGECMMSTLLSVNGSCDIPMTRYASGIYIVSVQTTNASKIVKIVKS